MRIRRKPWAAKELETSSLFVADLYLYAGRIGSLFPAGRPLAVELGCGKGLFISAAALADPETNFIGVDIKSDILAVAHRNIMSARADGEPPPSNLRLIPFDITGIGTLLTGTDISAESIYINFPNPWPKERHKKRRLTHPRQLSQYRRFLKDGGDIFFKTDFRPLFSDTLSYLGESGFSVCFASEDYYRDVIAERRLAASEHELMFRERGFPIYYIEAKKL